MVIYLAKRHNNNKRKALYINSHLCKHLPAKTDNLKQYVNTITKQLAQQLDILDNDEPITMIGFAETATGFSGSLMLEMAKDYKNISYIQTTRLPNIAAEYIAFEEEHSHAPNQVLYLTQQQIKTCKLYILVEDEISTGQTICNTINKIKAYNDKAIFIVATLLDTTNYAHKRDLERHDVKGIFSLFSDKDIIQSEGDQAHQQPLSAIALNHTAFSNYTNFKKFRVLTTADEFIKQTEAAIDTIYDTYKKLSAQQEQQIPDRIITLEEYNHVAIALADKYFPDTPVQSTTRSPIKIQKQSIHDENYPINTGIIFNSPYIDKTPTYLYNIPVNQSILLVVESKTIGNRIKPLVKTLQHHGNKVFISHADQKLITSSYKATDVICLLQDMKDSNLKIIEPDEKIDKSTHYSEFIRKETAGHIDLYENSLYKNIITMNHCLNKLEDYIYSHTETLNIVLISLARAGTPVGIALKHRLDKRAVVYHYTVSVLRDKGLDTNALDTIFSIHGYDNVTYLFVDGWISKGGIYKELRKSTNIKLLSLTNLSAHIDASIDQDNIYAPTDVDIEIPHMYLNATVSGLMSRTCDTKDGFHGAITFDELKADDQSYHYINKLSLDLNNMKIGYGEVSRAILRREVDIIMTKDLRHALVNIAQQKGIVVGQLPDDQFNPYDIIAFIK